MTSVHLLVFSTDSCFLVSLVLLTITNICSVCAKKMLIPLNRSPIPFWIWCALLVLVPLTQKKEKMADTWAPKNTEAKTCGCPAPPLGAACSIAQITSPPNQYRTESGFKLHHQHKMPFLILRKWRGGGHLCLGQWSLPNVWPEKRPKNCVF